MTALLIIAALTVGQVDAGSAADDAPFAQLDAPLAWKVPMGSPDGGVAVCMDEPTAVANARELVGYRAQAIADDAALRNTDPAWLRITIIAVVAVAAGAALTYGGLSATGHLR